MPTMLLSGCLSNVNIEESLRSLNFKTPNNPNELQKANHILLVDQQLIVIEKEKVTSLNQPKSIL